MIAMSGLLNLHKETILVLPEPQYPVCARLQSAKLEPLILQRLC